MIISHLGVTISLSSSCKIWPPTKCGGPDKSGNTTSIMMPRRGRSPPPPSPPQQKTHRNGRATAGCVICYPVAVIYCIKYWAGCIYLLQFVRRIFTVFSIFPPLFRCPHFHKLEFRDAFHSIWTVPKY